MPLILIDQRDIVLACLSVSVSLFLCLSAKNFNICHNVSIVRDVALLFHMTLCIFWKDLSFYNKVKVICQFQGQISSWLCLKKKVNISSNFLRVNDRVLIFHTCILCGEIFFFLVPSVNA